MVPSFSFNLKIKSMLPVGDLKKDFRSLVNKKGEGEFVTRQELIRMVREGNKSGRYKPERSEQYMDTLKCEAVRSGHLSRVRSGLFKVEKKFINT